MPLIEGAPEVLKIHDGTESLLVRSDNPITYPNNRFYRFVKIGGGTAFVYADGKHEEIADKPVDVADSQHEVTISSPDSAKVIVIQSETKLPAIKKTSTKKAPAKKASSGPKRKK
jgi:hypothetical protein